MNIKYLDFSKDFWTFGTDKVKKIQENGIILKKARSFYSKFFWDTLYISIQEDKITKRGRGSQETEACHLSDAFLAEKAVIETTVTQAKHLVKTVPWIPKFNDQRNEIELEILCHCSLTGPFLVLLECFLSLKIFQSL